LTAFLIFLGSIPQWAASAIVGALAGVIGALVGAGFGKIGWQKASKYLPILLIAASLPITRNYIVPAGVDAALNQGVPRQVDEITTLEKVHQTPEGIAYDFRVSGDLPEGVSGQTVKDMQLSALCMNWRPYFISKTANRIDYRYQWSGSLISFALVPEDCP
jgi:hypothetical protein